MICVNQYIVYITIPFTFIGILNSIIYLCKKNKCEDENINSVNSFQINLE